MRWLHHSHARPGRSAGLAIALLILAACSSGQSTNWSEVFTAAFHSIRSDRPGITLEQAASVPYASVGVRVDGGNEILLALAGKTGTEALWTSASRIVLLTRNGRIVRTAGIEHNLTEARIVEGSRGAPPTDVSASSRWELDFADLNLYSVQVRCTSVVRGPETVKNFTVNIPTIHVDETCRSDQLDWSFVNSYWISPTTGLTWRTIQYVNPKMGPIEVEILRPATAS